MTNEQEAGEREPQPALPATGLLLSLRRLLAHGIEMLELRVEQLSLDFEAEKLRLFAALAHSLLALLMAAAALGMFSLCALLVTPERWRWLTALVLGLMYSVLAGVSWRRARRQLSQSEGALGGTAAELGRDRDALEP